MLASGMSVLGAHVLQDKHGFCAHLNLPCIQQLLIPPYIPVPASFPLTTRRAPRQPSSASSGRGSGVADHHLSRSACSQPEGHRAHTGTNPSEALLRCCPASAVSLGVVWYTSGLGYVMSVMLEPANSMVASVAVCLVLGGFFNGIEPRLRTLSPAVKVIFGERSWVPRPPHPPRRPCWHTESAASPAAHARVHTHPLHV